MLPYNNQHSWDDRAVWPGSTAVQSVAWEDNTGRVQLPALAR